MNDHDEDLEVKSNSSSSSSCCFADVGFMFEGEQPTETRVLYFSPSNEIGTTQNGQPPQGEEEGTEEEGIRVEIDCVDDEPGAVQSGHYLWPAAPALAQYLVNTYYRPNNHDGGGNTKRIIELGAGCGLVGLTALQIFEKAECIVFTDHDPGTLLRAKGNHAATLSNLTTSTTTNMSYPKVFFESLTWGEDKDVHALELATSNNSRIRSINGQESDDNHDQDGTTTEETDRGFDLVLGSDLIYCKENVFPLLRTTRQLLLSKATPSCSSSDDEVAIKADPKMILSQSFPYEIDTELEIDKACLDLNLERRIIFCELEDGGVRVQTFCSSSS